MSSEENKTSLTFIDINSISPVYYNPKKAWKELLESVTNIYKNFIKSEIDPEELRNILVIDEKNKNNVPDISSIGYIISVINLYVTDYKISNATAIFLEFKRQAAVYLFAIGSQEKALDLLKEIVTVVSDVTNNSNPDINLTCIRDCVRLNQASIHFWLGDFDESRQLLEKVITYYEGTNEELYLIKMANFVSVGFTYLAWIYAKTNEFEDAERAFLHSLKVLRLVKQYTKKSLGEENFINVRVKKIFIYDQLINFYTFTKQMDQCAQPLQEILKMMDKENFEYDMDVKPENHLYYYATAVYYNLRLPLVDLSKCLHYMFNIMNIIYKNSEAFDLIPRCFYEKMFFLLEIIHMNENKYIWDKVSRKKRKSGKLDTDSNLSQITISDEKLNRCEQLFTKLNDYFDEVIANYDEEKVWSLNTEGGTVVDNMITLDKFAQYVRCDDFCEYNFIRDIKKKTEENMTVAYKSDFEINEIYLVKFLTERMLFKFAMIITDLVDSKTITETICLEGLNGFLVIENDELILNCIYRYMVRDGNHMVYPEITFNKEDEINNKGRHDRKLESVRIISIKNLEFKFAPLYYKRITYKLNKDAKNFNFSIYLAMVNTLYSKKLYYPCVTLLGLMIEEIAASQIEFYAAAGGHQKTECFLHLYEFLIYLQVYLLITLKNYDRALYQLIRIIYPINEMNTIIYKTLLGICLGHLLYYDLAVTTLCEAYYLIEPLLTQYGVSDNSKDLGKTRTNNEQPKKKMAPEKLNIYRTSGNLINNSVCYRCRVDDEATVTVFCLHCKKAKYCSDKCCKKNKPLHKFICKIYLKDNPVINEVLKGMMDNYKNAKDVAGIRDR